MKSPDIPGSKAPAIVQIVRWSRGNPEYVEGLRRRFGSVFAAKWGQSKPVIVVSGASAVREVLEAKDCVDGSGNAFMRPTLGSDSLFSLIGEAHSETRRLIAPALHGQEANDHAAITERIANETVWETGAVIESLPTLMSLFGRSIQEILWGRDRIDLTSDLMKEMELALRWATCRSVTGAMMIIDPRSPVVRRCAARQLAPLDSEVQSVLDSVRRHPSPNRRDVMSCLIALRDETGSRPSDSALRDHAVTFLAAGHETAATASSWLFDSLAHAPEIQEQLASGDDELYRACVYEVLRLRPVVPFVMKTTTRPIVIDGWEIPEKSTLVLGIRNIHLDPNNWERPSEFLPDRWLGKPSAHFEKQHTWLPFGAGANRCLGARLAVLQIEAVARSVVSRYRIVPVGKPEPTDFRSTTSRPKNNGKMRLEPRA